MFGGDSGAQVSAVGAILIWRRDDGAFGTIVSPELAEAQRSYVEDGWSRKDLAASRAMERGFFFSGEPFADRHVCSEKEIEESEFYKVFRVRHGLGAFAGIAVSPDPRVGVVLSLHCPLGSSQFSDSQLGVLRHLARYVEQSLRLSTRLLDTELTNVGLSEALARLGIGVYALDSLARVIFANPAGRRLLGKEISIVGDRLRVHHAGVRAEVERAIGDALRHPSDALAEPRPIMLEHALSDRPMVFYVLPIRASAEFAQQFLTSTRALVLLIEAKLGEPADPAVVRDILGLTLGEARIAALVGAGLRPRQAAERLGIAEETARNVLKRVFVKTGISRQSELSALLSRLVLR